MTKSPVIDTEYALRRDELDPRHAARLGPCFVVRGGVVRLPGEVRRQVTLDEGDHLADGDVAVELAGERGDAGVGDAAGDEPVVPAHVDVAVDRETVHGDAA